MEKPAMRNNNFRVPARQLGAGTQIGKDPKM